MSIYFYSGVEDRYPFGSLIKIYIGIRNSILFSSKGTRKIFLRKKWKRGIKTTPSSFHLRILLPSNPSSWRKMVESLCTIVECDVIKGYGLTTSCYATVEFYTPVIYGVMGVVTFIQSLPASVLTLSSHTDQYYNRSKKYKRREKTRTSWLSISISGLSFVSRQEQL